MAVAEPIETIEQLAEIVRRGRMVAPAIFMLELCKPLTGCARELYVASESLQALIFGRTPLPVLRTLLSSSARVEELVQLLEREPARESIRV
jgi:hypothetical protein